MPSKLSLVWGKMVTVAGNGGKVERGEGKGNVKIMQQVTEDLKNYFKSKFL